MTLEVSSETLAVDVAARLGRHAEPDRSRTIRLLHPLWAMRLPDPATSIRTVIPETRAPRPDLRIVRHLPSAPTGRADTGPSSPHRDVGRRRHQPIADQLEASQRVALRQLFLDRLLPVLTPLAVDPAHPFRQQSAIGNHVAVVVHDPVTGRESFARVMVPAALPRFVAVGNGRSIPVEEVIAAHADLLFTGLDVVATAPFRIRARAGLFGPSIRVEVDHRMSDLVLALLVAKLGVRRNEVIRVGASVRGQLADRAVRTRVHSRGLVGSGRRRRGATVGLVAWDRWRRWVEGVCPPSFDSLWRIVRSASRARAPAAGSAAAVVEIRRAPGRSRSAAQAH